MASLRLTATVTEDRQLRVELPDSLPIGAEVEITLEMPSDEATPLSEEEVAEIMDGYRKATQNTQPSTGEEIIALLEELRPTGWEHITDGAAWVEEQRRKRRPGTTW